jgi:Tfp pilus assembly protein PilX
MSARLRQETGSTLIAAVLIVFCMLAFGAAVLASVDTQSQTSAKQRTREAGFNLAEAALNATAIQVARTWPSSSLSGTLPSSCDSGSTNTYCPQPSAITGGYTSTDYGTACASSPTTPSWQTMVRDNSTSEQYFTQTVLNRAAYDANNDGIVWLYSKATSKCHTIAMVSQITRNTVPIAFPSNVVTANWIATSNQGKKVIIDTLGSGSQPAPVVARCNGLSAAQCLKYDSGKGQVQPPAVRTDSSASASTLTTAQIDALESQASAAGTLWASGQCPTTASQLASVGGAPVVVKGPCNISVTGNTTINSASSPGALIVENGTFTLGGTLVYYGLVYMVNRQNSSGSVVTIQGNANITGVVSIDGNGGLTAGSSKTNLTNDPKASTLLKGIQGANMNKNTFRVVPTS